MALFEAICSDEVGKTTKKGRPEGQPNSLCGNALLAVHCAINGTLCNAKKASVLSQHNEELHCLHNGVV